MKTNIKLYIPCSLSQLSLYKPIFDQLKSEGWKEDKKKNKLYDNLSIGHFFWFTRKFNTEEKLLRKTKPASPSVKVISEVKILKNPEIPTLPKGNKSKLPDAVSHYVGGTSPDWNKIVKDMLNSPINLGSMKKSPLLNKPKTKNK